MKKHPATAIDSFCRSRLPGALMLAMLPLTAGAQIDVLTQHNDGARTGANLHEVQLTPSSVNEKSFGMLFKHNVDDQVYTQPLIVSNVKLRGGTHDLLFVTTVNNSVYAFDAGDATATEPVWHVNFGTPANLHDAAFGCLDMNGNMGIIGTPVIDAQAHAVYVVALTRVGDRFLQRLHALDLATGSDLPQSPVTIQAPGFDPLMQSQRPALALSQGTVYIGYASHCDKQPYHGYLLGYDAATLAQTAVFNTSPGGQGASIWQSGQAPAFDAQGNLYVVAGNGSWNGTTQWSESFLKLDPHLKLLGWFTPTNHDDLDKRDNDLNSSGATLIPGSSLVLGGGKEGILYSLDTAKLGGLGDEHSVQHFAATHSHLHSLVFWESATRGRLLYVWGQRDKARVYRIEHDKILQTPVMTRPETNEGHPGAMLSLSANGRQDGILWAAIHATGDSWHESRPGILHAYQADDISVELWNSLQNAPRDNCANYSKMAPPTIANGKVYLASFGSENAGTGEVCVYGLLPTGDPLPSPSGLRVQASGTSIALAWNAVSDAETYTVQVQQNGSSSIAASGLTTATFLDSAPQKGSGTYRVRAVNRQGAGAWSAVVQATPQNTPMPRMAH